MSSKLVRILHKNFIRVVGVLIDDFLFHSPALEDPADFVTQLKATDTVMAVLGACTPE